MRPRGAFAPKSEIKEITPNPKQVVGKMLMFQQITGQFKTSNM